MHNYEKRYQINKALFIRKWIKGDGYINRDNPSYVGNSLVNRYCMIRASMDTSSCDNVLKTMLKEKWSKKDTKLVCLAWATKINLKPYLHSSQD